MQTSVQIANQHHSITSTTASCSLPTTQVLSTVWHSSTQPRSYSVIVEVKVDRTAMEINEMENNEMISIIEGCLFKEYMVGVESKSSRLIIRSIERLEDGEFE